MPYTRSRKASLYFILHLVLVAGLGLTAIVVDAAENSATHAERQRYEIQAGPLGPALNRFERRTGLTLSFDSALIEGKTTPGVLGEYTAREALARLLADTGLAARFTDADTVVLVKASGEDALAPISVVATGEGAYSPVDGYVATRSATATKTDTPLIETPRSVSVITRDRMDAQGADLPEEALRYSAGVQTEQFGFDSRQDFFTIRGFDATRYRDGLRMVETGSFGNSNTDIYGAERIEVLRGPASVLYGQGDAGGLVNYVSKRPTRQSFGQAAFEPGNHDQWQGKFDLGGPIDAAGTFSYRLTGLARDSDTQIDFIEDDRLFVAPAFTWRPSEATSLTVLTHYQDDSTGTPSFLPASGTVEDNPNGQIPVRRFAGERDFEEFEHTEYAVGYLFEHRLSRAWTLRQNLRYDWVDLDTETAFGAGLDPSDPQQRTLNRFAFAVDADSAAFSVDNQAELKAMTGTMVHTVLLGIDYRRNDFDQITSFGGAPSIDIFDPDYGADVPEPPVVADTTTTDDLVGLYMQDQINLGEHWVVSFGGRYDSVDSKVKNNLSGSSTEDDEREFTARAGLLYRSAIGLAPYINYSESFVPVSGTNARGEPFDPETGQQFELGMKYQPPGFESFITLAVFDLRRQNVLTPDPDNPMNRIQTGEVRSRGVEIEAVATLATGLDLSGSVTLLDLEITKSNAGDEGNVPASVPEELASLYADYTIQQGQFDGLGFGLGVRHRGSSFASTANTLKVDDYTLVDTAIHYDWYKYRLALNAHNLFDKEHVAGCAGSSACFYGAARTIEGSLRYRW